ncbi:unnamed protein product [Caenorhabditis nigoni]
MFCNNFNYLVRVLQVVVRKTYCSTAKEYLFSFFLMILLNLSYFTLVSGKRWWRKSLFIPGCSKKKFDEMGPIHRGKAPNESVVIAEDSYNADLNFVFFFFL